MSVESAARELSKKVHIFARKIKRGKRYYKAVDYSGKRWTYKSRNYQACRIPEIIEAGKRSFLAVVVELATGTGKTHIMARVCLGLPLQHNKRILVVSHGSHINIQFAREFSPDDDKHLPRDLKFSDDRTLVHTCTIQQLCHYMRNDKRKLQAYLENFKYVMFDECHHYPDGSTNYRGEWVKFTGYCIQHGIFMIGFSATPERHDGKQILAPANKVYFLKPYDIHDGVNDRYLCEVYGEIIETNVTPKSVTQVSDEIVLKFEDVDFDERAKFIHRHLKRVAKNIGKRICQSIVFVRRIKDAEKMKEIFDSRGGLGRIEVVTGKTKNREEIFAAYCKREINMIINVQVVTEAIDLPPAELIAMCRSVKSRNLYMQMLGRGVRPDGELKAYCTVIDFVDNIGSALKNLVVASKALGEDEFKSGELVKRGEREARPAGTIVHEELERQVRLFTRDEFLSYEELERRVQEMEVEKNGKPDIAATVKLYYEKYPIAS